MSENNPTFRRLIDKKLEPITALKIEKPNGGWLGVIQKALGIPTNIMAARAGVSSAAAVQAMRSEAAETISLATLRRFANGMECDLVYALVPKNESSLEDMVKQAVYEVAQKMASSTDHHMRLERQAVSQTEVNAQIDDIAKNLYVKFPASLWLLYFAGKGKVK